MRNILLTIEKEEMLNDKGLTYKILENNNNKKRVYLVNLDVVHKDLGTPISIKALETLAEENNQDSILYIKGDRAVSYNLKNAAYPFRTYSESSWELIDGVYYHQTLSDDTQTIVLNIYQEVNTHE